MTLAWEWHTARDRDRLILHGEIDLSTRDKLATGLRHARSHAVTEVDLHDVTFLDCSGIGVLVAACNTACRSGRAVIVSHPKGIVRFLLEITDVLAYLTIPSRGVTHLATPVSGLAQDAGPAGPRPGDTHEPFHRHPSGR